MTDHSALIERLEGGFLSSNPHHSEVYQTNTLLALAAAALRDLTEWREIETAPKDGTNILVYEDGATTVVFWDDYLGSWLHPYRGGKTRWPNLTHWLPLPSAPNQAKEAGE